MTFMVESRCADTPAMPEFNVSNNLPGDRAALDAAWERDGYWFFRGVLDQDAVARLRQEYISVLAELGVIEPGHSEVAIYNGAPLDDYPIVMGGDPDEDPLLACYPRDTFLKDPQVAALFETIFGDEVFWVPNTEFHAVPPRPGHNGNRFNYVHADGPNNKGLPLRVCCIPLAPIAEETGGLALTEGLHKPRLGDFARPAEGIDPADVQLMPGAAPIMSLATCSCSASRPGTAVAKRSDRFFRLSMDIRGMRKSDQVPTVGTVAAIDRNAIAIDSDDGKQHVFRIDRDTFCRVDRSRQSGMPLALDKIPEQVKLGAPVYVASHHGTATFIRPQH